MIIYSNSQRNTLLMEVELIDTLRNILKKAASSSASKSSLSLMKKMASSELGREAITAAKSAGKDLASSAIFTAKDVAIDKGRKTIAKVNSITKTPIPAASDSVLSRPVGLTKKSKDTLSEMIYGSLKSEEPNSLGSYESMFGGSLVKPAIVVRTTVPVKPAPRSVKDPSTSGSVAHSAPKKLTKENAMRIQDLVKGRGMMRT